MVSPQLQHLGTDPAVPRVRSILFDSGLQEPDSQGPKGAWEDTAFSQGSDEESLCPAVSDSKLLRLLLAEVKGMRRELNELRPQRAQRAFAAKESDSLKQHGFFSGTMAKGFFKARNVKRSALDPLGVIDRGIERGKKLRSAASTIQPLKSERSPSLSAPQRSALKARVSEGTGSRAPQNAGSTHPLVSVSSEEQEAPPFSSEGSDQARELPRSVAAFESPTEEQEDSAKLSRWVKEPAQIGDVTKRSAALWAARATRRVNATPAEFLERCVDLLLAPPGQSYESGVAVLPDCRLRIAWDFVFCLVCFMESSFIILYVCASYDDASANTFLFGKLIATVVFLFDVWVRRRTAMLTGWMIDEDVKSISARYARSWMPFDVFVSFPWDMLLLFASTTAHHWVQCVRLCRVIRVQHLFKASTPVRETPRYVELVQGSFWILLTVHLTASIWLAIASDMDLAIGHMASTAAGEDLVTRYNLALYWAVITMTSVGYGDISPVQNSTRIYAQFVATFGAMLLLCIGGRIGALFITTDPFILSQEERKRRLQAVMDRNGIPWDIQKEAFTIFPSILETNIHDYQDTLDELPTFIQDKLTNHIKERLIRRVPMFKSATQDFIKRLVVALDEVVVPPGELITRVGTTAAEMWFLQYGIAEVLDFQGSIAATLRSGSWFGEMSIVRETERVASVRTLTPCALYRLDKDSFELLVAEYPVFFQKIQYEAEKQLAARRARARARSSVALAKRRSVAVWQCQDHYECDTGISVLAMAWVAVARKRFKRLLERAKERRRLGPNGAAGQMPAAITGLWPEPPPAPPTIQRPSTSQAELDFAARDIQRIWRGFRTRRELGRPEPPHRLRVAPKERAEIPTSGLLSADPSDVQTSQSLGLSRVCDEGVCVDI
eukprot:TRINITY_DN32900_c0_g1_i1.p1 TRINITY_DN32900_c0_g1~~TRINITY_DN32900_c0_g1_i1.p1  ORF type:complete len:895 (+),score=191.93 TRINITY_DN32900_c0_g1_i1:70-2754(+)